MNLVVDNAMIELAPTGGLRSCQANSSPAGIEPVRDEIADRKLDRSWRARSDSPRRVSGPLGAASAVYQETLPRQPHYRGAREQGCIGRDGEIKTHGITWSTVDAVRTGFASVVS